MARTVYFQGTPGADHYLKQSPRVESPWSTGVTPATEGVAGEFSAVINDEPHTAYRQAGDDPAISDYAICQFGKAIDVSPTIAVTPGVALQTLQQDGSPLVAYRGSLTILSLTVLDAALQPINLAGKTLQLQIGQPGRPALQTVSSLTATGTSNNVVSFRPLASLVQMPRSTCWSLFDVTESEHPEHIVSGVFEVRDAISPQ